MLEINVPEFTLARGVSALMLYCSVTIAEGVAGAKNARNFKVVMTAKGLIAPVYKVLPVVGSEPSKV